MYKPYESQPALSTSFAIPYSAIPFGSKILLYGAGDVGQKYYNEVTCAKYVNIVQWCDSNIKGKDLPLVSKEQIDWEGFDYAVIAINSFNAAKEIYGFFREKGVAPERIIWNEAWPSSFLEFDSRYIERMVAPTYNQANKVLAQRSGLSFEEKKCCLSDLARDIVEKKHLILPRLVVELGTCCTLKCKYCNNLMPYYKKPYWVKTLCVINDIEKILASVDGIISLELIGGEPFIYPELEKVLEFVIAQEKIWEVELTTNATAIPKDIVLNTLRNPKVVVHVSDYSVVSNTDRFVDTLLKNGIRYVVLKDLDWRDSGKPIQNGKDENYLRYVYAKCSSSKFCKTLLKGNIYACARSASLHDLGYVSDTNGYVDIYSALDLKSALKKFFTDKDADFACDYCTITDEWRRVDAGEQIE